MIKTGAALVQKLDERGLEPKAAFWLYLSDVQQWKLVIATEALGEIGPKDFYQKIQETIAANSDEFRELSLDDIALSKTDAPLVSLLRSAISTGPGIGGIRFTNNAINGTVIDDAYIYRLVA